ncbi:MAG: class I SAM-dependent methyltransferase [Candidatus Cloacimonetes bacterium]|nr:class I SAM-dependent methyltransferase [Candidatus Cloacimonadota bacterium]
MTLRKIIKKTVNLMGYDITRNIANVNNDEYLYLKYTKRSIAKKLFLNIGAGSFYHKHWTNVDYSSDWYSKHQKEHFINYNIMSKKPLPFEDNSIELAYSSHVFEHVKNDAVQSLLSELYRVLKQGGGIRITCPDSLLFYQSLLNQDLSFWNWRHTWFTGSLSSGISDISAVTIYDYIVREIATPFCRFYKYKKWSIEPQEVENIFTTEPYTDFFNYFTSKLEFDSDRPGDHINWWDEAKIIDFLHNAGFKKVYPSRANQSLFAPLRNVNKFDTTAPHISLFVEARK